MGSPGARKGHAGKYGEPTPSRQRGGSGTPLPYPLCESQVFLAKSQTVRRMVDSRASFVKTYLRGSVPVGKSPLELPQGGYEASAARQQAVTEGPGGDGPGGAAIRPGRCARLPHWLKRRRRVATPLHSRKCGYRGWTDQVVGGVAWTQRPKTLTDESPTSSRGPPGNAGL
jgi:hypothetical protein